MRRVALSLIALVALVGLGAPPALAAPSGHRQPSFDKMEGTEAINGDVPLGRLSFDARVWVRGLTASKSAVYTVTFTVRFSTGGDPIVRADRPVEGKGRFTTSTSAIPTDPWFINIPSGATWVSVDASLSKREVKTGSTTVVDTMESGQQPLYTYDQLQADTRLGWPLFTVFAAG